MGRAESREELFKLVFEYSLTKEVNDFSLNSLKEEKKVDIDFVEKMYKGIVEKYDELVSEIGASTAGYTTDRIYKVDLSLLVLALYEIKYVEEIPTAVSINEVLNLAKKYSTEKSASFINGVLSNIVKGKA